LAGLSAASAAVSFAQGVAAKVKPKRHEWGLTYRIFNNSSYVMSACHGGGNLQNFCEQYAGENIESWSSGTLDIGHGETPRASNYNYQNAPTLLIAATHPGLISHTTYFKIIFEMISRPSTSDSNGVLTGDAYQKRLKPAYIACWQVGPDMDVIGGVEDYTGSYDLGGDGIYNQFGSKSFTFYGQVGENLDARRFSVCLGMSGALKGVISVDVSIAS
jgi:hypothetical protein